MLDHPDAGDGVEPLPLQRAIVGDAKLDAIGEVLFTCTLARVRDLRLREGDPEHLRPVALCGVNREAPPAAADVKDTLPRLQAQFGAHQVELRLLRLLERPGPAREDRAAVCHRGVEEEPEQLVADVVVMTDGARVARDRVAPAPEAKLGGRASRRDHQAAGAQDRGPETEPVRDRQRRRLPPVDDAHDGVEVIHLEHAGDVRATQPQLTRRANEMRHRARRAERKRRPPV